METGPWESSRYGTGMHECGRRSGRGGRGQRKEEKTHPVDLVEAIHVELPDKGGKLLMFEPATEHLACKALVV